jgi:hypothetical protein
MESAEVIDRPQDRPDTRIGRIGLSALTLFAANASLLFLYLVYDLTLFQLVIVLWIESFWIGLFCAIKIITASIFGDPYGNRYVEVSAGTGLFLSLLSIAMVGGQFLGIFGFTGMAIAFVSDSMSTGGDSGAMFEDLGLIIGAAGMFFVGHALSFVINFILLGEYRTARAGSLLSLPFRRSLALLGAIVIAFGALYALPAFASTTLFAVLLMTLKVLWDYRLHVAERNAFSG